MPKPCGIAAFTTNLTASILKAQDKNEGAHEVCVVAMNDAEEKHHYPEIVKHTINQQEKAAYTKAAYITYKSDANSFILHHEFGIFDSESGVFIFDITSKKNESI